MTALPVMPFYLLLLFGMAGAEFVSFALGTQVAHLAATSLAKHIVLLRTLDVLASLPGTAFFTFTAVAFAVGALRWNTAAGEIGSDV